MSMYVHHNKHIKFTTKTYKKAVLSQGNRAMPRVNVYERLDYFMIFSLRMYRTAKFLLPA